MKTNTFTMTVKDGATTVEISDRDCLLPIWREIMSQTGNPDDAGCDWYTDGEGQTYIAGDWDWRVSTELLVAAMVDTVNFMTLGRTLKMQPEVAE